MISQKANNISVISHRGRCYSKYPDTKESSLEAFANVFLNGINFVETDLWSTKDKEMILNHDPKINVYDKILITDSIYKNIKSFSFGLRKRQIRYPWRRNNNVITLKMLLEKFPLMKVNLELKSLTNRGITNFEKLWIRELAALIIVGNYSNSFVISSFNWDLVDYMNNYLPNIRKGYLLEKNRVNEVFERTDNNSVYSVHPHYTVVDDDFMKKSINRNLKVFTWTVNKKEEIISMINFQVNGIITDYPLLAKKILEEYNFNN